MRAAFRGLSAFVLGTLLALSAGEAADRAWWLVRARRASAALGPGVFELYVVGESTAEGVPFNPRGGFPPIVSLLLGGRIQGRRIEIINLARSGNTIYPQAIAFQRRVRYRDRGHPGAVLVYCGHNDNGMWNRGSPGRLGAWSAGAFRRSWLISDLLLWTERAGAFRGPRSLSTYGDNLEWTVDIARQAGLVPVLSTVIGDLTDIEPWIRKPKEASWEQVRRLLAKGDELEASGRVRDAYDYYGNLRDRMPEMSAYLDYRRARCDRRLGRYDEARELFWRASDRGDSGYGRATREQNEFVRALARARSVSLVDAVKAFEAGSGHRLVGDEWFEDGQHPNLRGCLSLAEGYAAALSAAFGGPPPRTDVTVESLPRRLGLTPADLIKAHLNSARWLLAVSRGHALPRQRLALARRRFEEVLELDPENFSGWLGLGVVQAAGREGVLMDQQELAWLDRYRLITYGQEYAVMDADRGAVARHLRGLGVSDEILRRIENGRSAPAR